PERQCLRSANGTRSAWERHCHLSERQLAWVAARSGGVSTFSVQGSGMNWWCLPAGFDYPAELWVVNDHGNHYNWEPSVDMPLADFLTWLTSVEPAFVKVS